MGERVLLVDDEEPLLKAYRRFLQPSAGDAPTGRAFEVETESPSRAGSYPIPRRQTLRAAGLHGALGYDSAVLEVDPLAALPTFLRMVYSLRGRPHRSWSQAEIELSLVPGPELPAVRVAGNAIAALTFLDVLPRP